MNHCNFKSLEMVPFSHLKGKTLFKIQRTDKEELIFTTTEGDIYIMFHEKDCCEEVYIEDICGDLQALRGSEILIAEERSNIDICDNDQHEWTFYEIRTFNESVTIRWHGESNGYYSTSVGFYKKDH